METLDSQIQYYEKKLGKIPEEYNTSMLCEWSVIREKELYFRREICRLDNIKKDRELKNKYFKTPIVDRISSAVHRGVSHDGRLIGRGP